MIRRPTACLLLSVGSLWAQAQGGSAPRGGTPEAGCRTGSSRSTSRQNSTQLGNSGTNQVDRIGTFSRGGNLAMRPRNGQFYVYDRVVTEGGYYPRDAASS